jgi:hypothetical protein
MLNPKAPAELPVTAANGVATNFTLPSEVPPSYTNDTVVAETTPEETAKAAARAIDLRNEVST